MTQNQNVGSRSSFSGCKGGKSKDREVTAGALRFLSLYLLVVSIALVGFASVSFSVRGLAQQTFPPVDPFGPFTEILPGQPKSALDRRGFSCRIFAYNYEGGGYERCTLDFTDGIFSRLYSAVSAGTIEQITFHMRENWLRVGDLALLLGPPLNREVHYMVGFFWQRKVVLAQTSTARITPFTPVWKVTFTNIG